MSVAHSLAEWAIAYEPSQDDIELAQRSLLDTMAVTIAARDHPIARSARELEKAGLWATLGHVLDFDDLQLESTAHVSVVCVPTALATGGGVRTYLAAAGVMTRLGTALGWRHYARGWHATCTAGTIAAAAGAAQAWGLDAERTAAAMALATPAAGGIQRAFGTDGKALQVGGAVDAGIRAARLARAGASADPKVLDEWLLMLGGSPDQLVLDGGAVPGGLAVKLYPCCYALQRPLSSVGSMRSGGIDAASVTEIRVRTPESTTVPLIHHAPTTGLQGKFSLEYAFASALLDDYPGFAAFTDLAVARPSAQRLIGLVETTLEPGGRGLLDGELSVAVHTSDGEVIRSRITEPPGSPGVPLDEQTFTRKLDDCTRGVVTRPSEWTWDTAASLLEEILDEA